MQIKRDENTLYCPFCGSDKLRKPYFRKTNSVECDECNKAVEFFQFE